MANTNEYNILYQTRHTILVSMSFLISFLFRDLIVMVWNHFFKADSFSRKILLQMILLLIIFSIVIVIHKFWNLN